MSSSRRHRREEVRLLARLSGTVILVADLLGFGMLGVETVVPTLLKLPDVNITTVVGTITIVLFILLAQVVLLPFVLVLFELPYET